MSGTPEAYDAERAAAYWSGPRHESGDELASVLSLGEPHAVNRAYDEWETGLLLEGLGQRVRMRALDLGAGVGRVSARVAPRVRRLTAGDLAAGMLGRLRRNVARARLDNVDAVRLRSDGLPFRDGVFDLVLCLGLLEHLPPSVQRATIAEAARVLRPEGLLALVLNNPASALLQDATDNPHRDGHQRENGYYCAVVPETSILEQAMPLFHDEVLGSNLFYSLQRHAARRLPPERRRDARLEPFFERAAAWDRALRPVGPLSRAAADHHLHLLVRR